jgi:hypothetical protein
MAGKDIPHRLGPITVLLQVLHTAIMAFTREVASPHPKITSNRTDPTP